MKNKLQNFLEALFQTISDVLSIGEKKAIPLVLNHFKGKELLEIGTKLTYYYFAFFLLFFGWKIPSLFFSPLNNIGDFLAGVFGPIAFGWLIIGYLMQNKELKNSVKQTSEAQRLARDQLEFQKKINDEHKRQEHNRNQPIFEIKAVNINCKKTMCHYSIELENRGAPAKEIILKKEGESASYLENYLGTGDLKTIGIVFKLKEPVFEKEEFPKLETLELHFIDAGFERQTCKIEIRAYKILDDAPSYSGTVSLSQLIRSGVTTHGN